MRKGREKCGMDVKRLSVVWGCAVNAKRGSERLGLHAKWIGKSPQKGLFKFFLWQTCFCWRQLMCCICCHSPAPSIGRDEMKTGNQELVKGFRRSSLKSARHPIRSLEMIVLYMRETRHELFSAVCTFSCAAASENIFTKFLAVFQFHVNLAICDSKHQQTKKYCATSEVHNGTF